LNKNNLLHDAFKFRTSIFNYYYKKNNRQKEILFNFRSVIALETSIFTIKVAESSVFGSIFCRIIPVR